MDVSDITKPGGMEYEDFLLFKNSEYTYLFNSNLKFIYAFFGISVIQEIIIITEWNSG